MCSVREICEHTCCITSQHILKSVHSIQLAGAVSLVQCPGAPRIPFFLGRKPPVAASPPNLVPEPFDTVQTILQRFGEVGFTAAEVVAVVGGSHSVAGADDIVPNQAGYLLICFSTSTHLLTRHCSVPFDQTPALFDSKCFNQTMQLNTH